MCSQRGIPVPRPRHIRRVRRHIICPVGRVWRVLVPRIRHRLSVVQSLVHVRVVFPMVRVLIVVPRVHTPILVVVIILLVRLVRMVLVSVLDVVSTHVPALVPVQVEHAVSVLVLQTIMPQVVLVRQ